MISLYHSRNLNDKVMCKLSSHGSGLILVRDDRVSAAVEVGTWFALDLEKKVIRPFTSV